MKQASQKERGTVLLTTLLIMTVMAAITVALMDDIQIAVKRTINVQAYAQADWQADGAEDFVRAYLQNDFADLPPEAKGVLLQAREPLILPTEGGVITLTLKDASQCFNLNAVINSEGIRNEEAVQEFIRLSELLGLANNQAIALANTLVDWQDADQQFSRGGAEDGSYLRKNPPYRTADTALSGPEEMRALNGMDEELWELFRPFVCTGDVGLMPTINVNSLSGERLFILAAALNVDSPDAMTAARTVLRDRPVTGYSDIAAIEAVLAETGIDGLTGPNTSDQDELDAAADVDVDEDQTDQVSGGIRYGIDVSSVFVEVVTEVGPAERVRTYRFDGLLGVDGAPSDSPSLTYRGWGRETFRPEIDTSIEANSESEGGAR